MKIKKRALSGIKQRMRNADDVKNTEIAKLVLDNHTVLDKEIDIITQAVTQTDLTKESEGYEEIMKFEESMKTEYPKFCQQTQDGGLQLADPKGWAAELEIMKVNFPAGAKYFDANEIRIKEILDEEIEIDLKSIGMTQLPADLSANDLRQLAVIIKPVSKVQV